MQSNRSQNCFSYSFKQRTIMSMHTYVYACMVGKLVVEVSANVLVPLLLQSFYETLNKLCSVLTFFQAKFFLGVQ